MIYDPESLRRFVAIVEASNMRTAADVVGVTQPALTRSLKLLEAAAGGMLFERRSRGLRLTPLGRLVHTQARHFLREHQLAEAELRALKNGEQGQLRVAAAPVWMTTILPPVLANVHQRYAQLLITLTSANYSEALAGLKEGEFDVFFGGFQRQESLPSFLVRKPLFDAKLVIVARSGHPILTSGFRTEDLIVQPWLSYKSEIAYLDTINASLQETCSSGVKASLQCDSMLTALELLRRGDYLAVLPSSFLSSANGQGLEVVATDLPAISYQSGPIYRRSLEVNQAVRLLLEESERQVSAFSLR
ncbi:MAG: LysR family transcriptional regulator [Roseibium sp.]|uniref:LysR family transcriptional regulator n=1 Tax=Roseibium sp. TaxID=1936156 RepID=UPI0026121E3E|nr:LysR family transcriptional regulator [Roseibium sp.]MCV0426584.1 LysR family transcriptional regulator [Roseibium sp.]